MSVSIVADSGVLPALSGVIYTPQARRARNNGS